HEAARDLPRALEILQEATAEAPADPAARQRLVDLFLRAGDWAAAVAALRDWEAVLSDQAARAALWIRIGDLQRDHGRDRRAAEDAYARAARLHPLGEGVFRVAALHRAAADLPALRAVLTGASAEMRRRLDEDPLDVPCLQRLRDLCRLKARGHEGDPLAGMAVDVLGQLLGLLGEAVEPLPGTRPTFAAAVGADFWRRLQAREVEAAVGTAGTVWDTIARAASELLPPAPPHPPPRDKVSAGAEPRLAWIEEAARALGLGGLKLGLAKRPDPNDDSVVIGEGGEPSLVVGRGALLGGAAVRFRVGRALWLLHAKGAALDRLSESELEGLFAAAASAVRAPDRAAAGTPDEIVQRARQLVRTMSRKEMKALEGQASRLDWDQLGAAAFRAGVLRTADRMGLLFAGDLPVALQIVCGKGASQPIGREVITAEPRALDLVRFALGEDFLALRAEVGAGGI
ncbi:MAG TPA: tetratricopeptide repeat protein, partial [Polyangia bacterium]